MAILPDDVDILILGFYGGEQRGVLPHWYLISSSLIADRQQHLCLCVNWWGNEKCPHLPHCCHCYSIISIQQRLSTDHSHSESRTNSKREAPRTTLIRGFLIALPHGSAMSCWKKKIESYFYRTYYKTELANSHLLTKRWAKIWLMGLGVPSMRIQVIDQ